MEKPDLKTVLKEEKKEKDKDTDKDTDELTIRKHKKPMQLRDIENRSSGTNRLSSKTESPENIRHLINKEKTEIFKQPWNRLDTGMKLNRIRLFTENEGIENDLTKEKQEELRLLLVGAIRNNKLSKNTDVEYDMVNCKVVNIKTLVFKDGTYSLLIPESKKAKKTTKSKSNIDRFLSKKT